MGRCNWCREYTNNFVLMRICETTEKIYFCCEDHRRELVREITGEFGEKELRITEQDKDRLNELINRQIGRDGTGFDIFPNDIINLSDLHFLNEIIEKMGVESWGPSLQDLASKSYLEIFHMAEELLEMDEESEENE